MSPKRSGICTSMSDAWVCVKGRLILEMVSAVMLRWANVEIRSQTIFIQLNFVCFLFERIKKILFLKCTEDLFSCRANVCLSLMLHIFLMTFHSLSCFLVHYQFCLLIHDVKTFVARCNCNPRSTRGHSDCSWTGGCWLLHRQGWMCLLSVRACLSVTAAAGGLVCVFTRSNFPWQLWSEHRLSSGMCTKRRGFYSSIMCL